MALRRGVAARQRAAHGDVWPIHEQAGATPPGWPGWPHGKRFAMVLTHDVEGLKGLARVERLVRLEQKRGYRSSFNFVPEGEYRISDDLRASVDGAGFEVGVHGMRHDGKLYSSKEHFAASAAKIREYARKWNASGFRSPLMQHKLSWLHELGLEYDASTFDTDPFEPQPDAAETIFPFWVQGTQGNGYVELPYSLPQDSSLFVVLRERNIDVWKRKLDWVAARGGMALLNTHPDYMCFEGTEQRDEFPVAYYEEFLQYAREKYSDVFWQALPRDVARYYRESIPAESRNTRKKVCMVAYSNYECDNRVRRYAETLISRGDLVDVIAISSGDTPLGEERIKGVNVYRIQNRERNEKSKWRYAGRLLRFLLSSSLFLARKHRERQYDAIHVHNVPDFLVFAAWYPKWTGTKIILDIHDIVPELYASKFKTRAGDLCGELLRKVEKASGHFSDHVIVSNHLWSQKLVTRSFSESKCTTFVNHVDEAIFYPRARTRNDGKFVIIFPGSFQWHQGLDIAIEAMTHILERVPEAEFHIYGGGPEARSLAELSKRLGLDGSVKFRGSVSLDEMPKVIANADLGVVPKRADSFGDEAYSTKIMEFMSQGVPVVVSRTTIDSFYYSERDVRFFASGDSRALAQAVLEIIASRDLRDSLIRNGFDYVRRNGWDVKKKEYFDLLDRLTVESFSECRLPGDLPAISRHVGS
jgi:glycosyltransferase involved in cell wall biosynthesis/peptidoglycan/xylan/chitin deacetylase (PgdA/CDA1 family)